jgi:hypothetical protein
VSQIAIFWPMLAQVLLVYIVYLVLGIRRYGSVADGSAKPSEFKTRGGEPEFSVTAANNLMNQFELPVLFYVLCISLFVSNGVSYITVALAWIFVLTRYAHAYIHVTSNRLRYRSAAFRLGWLVLGVMWIWFALHLLGAV